MKSLLIFDLDGTLAKSKQPLDPQMAQTIKNLLQKFQIAVISGCDFSQFQTQFLAHLSPNSNFQNLTLLPTCGSAFWQFHNKKWQQIFSNKFSDEAKSQITQTLQTMMTKFNHHPDQIWGDIIEDRDSQITFSALGQKAPLEAKQLWDPSKTKRLKMREFLLPLLPDFEVRIGGTTSLDITRPGIDKAFGIKKIHELMNIPFESMLFFGDDLEEGGNDFPATTLVDCLAVSDPDDCISKLQPFLKS